MVRLQLWQWAVLGLPIAIVISFLLVAAGLQIHEWGINWIWAIVGLVFVGWRWLLVEWTRPALQQIEDAIAELSTEETEAIIPSGDRTLALQAAAAATKIIEDSAADPPLWQDWNAFWQRCLSVIQAIAQIYYPQTQKPLLNIYVPQAYALLRGTVDDLDQWMQRLAPVLNQLTIGQAYQAYELYQRLEPSARKFLNAWNWAQWLLNPAAAVAKTATQRSSNRATQELIGNLSQLLREAALKNLARQAIALYGGTEREDLFLVQPAAPQQANTLRDIIAQANDPDAIASKPVDLMLVGRTGAGKSSLINTLFVQANAAVDVLPSTDQIQTYRWQTDAGETLTLWDTPGYEQASRPDLRAQVLDRATQTDLVLLVNPALDPSLQMDLEFLTDLKAKIPDLPALTVVTQVDRLRPLRDWQPPYNWQTGNCPKEVSIRDAVQYRTEVLAATVLPIVTASSDRRAWGTEAVSLAILDAIAPAKQARLARFLQNLDARTKAATQIIDHYSFQITTTQGLAAFLKSPVLRFISTLATGSPSLALLLGEKLPVEQIPIVVGKLQMAYELYNLLTANAPQRPPFDPTALWDLLVEPTAAPDRAAWAFGTALTEYWSQNLSLEELRSRYHAHLA